MVAIEFLSALDSGVNCLRHVFAFVVEIYQTAKLNNFSTKDFTIISFVLINTGSAVFWLWKKYNTENVKIEESKAEITNQVQDLNGDDCKNMEKNVEVQLTRHFEGNSELYNNILKYKITENDILNTPVEELTEMLYIKNRKDIEKFSKMRDSLRLASFEKMDRIAIDEKHLYNLNWNEVCQLVEEQLRPASQKQRGFLYKYIENHDINGIVLLTKKEKDIIKRLELNEGQTAKFKALMEKIKEKRPNNGVNVKDSNVAVLNQGNQNKYDHISVSGTPPAVS